MTRGHGRIRRRSRSARRSPTRGGADLFLSIHANSSRNPQGPRHRDLLPELRGNPHAEAVAARENAISAATMKDLQGLVKAITLNSKIDESRDFAAAVQEAMVENIRGRRPRTSDRGVHTAPFYVLIGANMPSVLAEIAFVSQPDEERLLQNVRLSARPSRGASSEACGATSRHSAAPRELDRLESPADLQWPEARRRALVFAAVVSVELDRCRQPSSTCPWVVVSSLSRPATCIGVALAPWDRPRDRLDPCAGRPGPGLSFLGLVFVRRKRRPPARAAPRPFRSPVTRRVIRP